MQFNIVIRLLLCPSKCYVLAISLTISKKLISVPLHSPISEMNIHVICHDGWPNGDKSEVTLKEKMEACMYVSSRFNHKAGI